MCKTGPAKMVNSNSFDMPESEGKILDGGKCECGICGKKKKLGGFINPTPGMEDRIPKIICIDCMMEQVALKKGISRKEALKRRKRMFDAVYAFQEVMFERYLKENNKEEFDSIEEANEVLDFVRRCWNRVPKEFREMAETFDKEELEKTFRELKLDLRTLSSSLKYKTSTEIGRNDPCPCGSGNKYKKCCGR